MTVIDFPTVVRPRPLPPVPPPKPRRPGGAGRDSRPGAVTTVPALRLTRRGRIVRDLAAGTAIGAVVLFADQITHTLAQAAVAFAPLFH